MAGGTLALTATRTDEPDAATPQPEPTQTVVTPGVPIGTIEAVLYKESGLDFKYFNNNFYVAKTGENTWMGFAKGITKTETEGVTTESNFAQLRAIYSTDPDAVIPDSLRIGDETMPVTQIYSDWDLYAGFSYQGPANSLTIPATVDYIYCSYTFYDKVQDMYLLGKLPQIAQRRLDFNEPHTLYVANEATYTAIEENPNAWQSNNMVPYGWDFEEVTVDVKKPGEFGDTYLTQFGNDWGAKRNIKVTGPINTIDLAAMKNLTKVRRLDLSATAVTELPRDFMSGKGCLQEIYLPTTLKTIGYRAFYWCKGLSIFDAGKAEIDKVDEGAFQYCPSMTQFTASTVKYTERYSFYQTGLSEFTPKGIEVVKYDAFYDVVNLKSIDLSNCNQMESYAFQNCHALDSINLSSLATIPDCAFINCESLTTVVFSNELNTIKGSAFRNTGLTELSLPESVRMIEGAAFYDCHKLVKANINEGLGEIKSDAFRNCEMLEEVSLPSTLRVIGSNAFKNTGIKKFTCRATIPPVANSSFANDGINMEETYLYVPPFSKDIYRNTQHWADFFIMRSITDPIAQISIDRPITITLDEESDSVLADNPHIELTYIDNNTIGQLTAEGDGTLSAGDVYINARLSGRYFHSGWWDNKRLTPTLINNATKMRADKVTHHITLRRYFTNEWYFISLPYDVKVKDIVPSENTYWVIRRYDSAARAAGQTDETWVNLTTDDTMEAGKGYILSAYHANKDPELTFTSGNSTTKNNMFRTGDATVAMTEYAAEFAHNRSWNLVGNPYPCYYDMHGVEDNFTAPVTVWNGSAYVAYSPADDDLMLAPYESFFVQRPADAEAIVFKAEGRRHAREGMEGYRAPARKGAPDVTGRNVFNFNLTGENVEDRARIVLNEQAEAAYEIGRDAGKFFAQDAANVQIYVNSFSPMSIDERPMGDGTATLGIRGAKGETVTLSLDGRFSSEYSVMLTDRATGITVDLTQDDYTFTTLGGDESSRLTLVFGLGGGEGTSAVESLKAELGADATVTVVNAAGAKVYTGSLERMSLRAGIYVVTSGNISRKVIVRN